MSEDITPKPVQPVSDNGGSITVDDGGGSLTIDGSVGITGSVTTTGGGGTEFAEDAAHTNGDAGKLILAVRRDTGSAFTSTDGDYTAIAADSNGRVKVVHDQALPAGANVIGTVTIQDGGNVVSIDDAGGSITVDGPLTDTQLRATAVPVSGTVTANAGTGPFPVSDNGGSLTVDGAVTADTELPAAASLADATANPSVPSAGSLGLVWNGSTWDRMPGNTSGLFVLGAVSSGTADSGGPVKIGGRFNTTTPTLTDGQRGDAQLDSRGSLKVALQSTNGATAANIALTADALALAAALRVNSATMLYNGATLDMARGDTTNGLDVDVTRMAALVAGTAYIGKTRITDGTLDVTLLNSAPGSDTGQVAVPVRVISQLGAGSGGGGTQYVEDVALGSTPTGTLSIARRVDTLGTLTPVVDDAISMRVNDRGALWVKHDGTMIVDGSAVTQPVSGTVTANAGTGPWPITDNGGSITVDGTFWQATQPVSGTVTANLAAGTNNIGDVDVLTLPGTYAEDLGHTNADVGHFILAVRNTGQAARTGADTDYSPISVDDKGNIYVVTPSGTYPVTDNGGSLTVDSAQLPAALAANGGLKIEGVASGVAVPVSGTFWQATQPVSGTVTANAGTGSFTVAGDVASAATDSGNPVKVGGRYNTTQPTLTDGQRGDAQIDTRGNLKVTLFGNNGVSSPGVIVPADAAAAASGLRVTSQALVYNGATWDMMRGDITNGLDVDVTRAPGTFAEDAAAASGATGYAILGKRLDDAQAAAALTDTDGDYTHLTTDSKGRQKVTISGEAYAQVTGNITASGAGTDPQTSSSSSVIVVPCADSGNITVQVSGTYGAGAVLTFEGSVTTTGTGWAAIGAVREDTQWAESSSRLPANTTRQWTIAVPGYKYIRIRCSTFVSGTLAITANPGGWLIEPIQPALPTGRVIFGTSSLTKTVTTSDAVPTADLVPTRDYVASAAVASVTVTAGKRLRLTNMTVAMRGAGTPVAAGFTARLRVNPSGAAVVTSPIVAEASIASTAALAVGAALSKDVPLDAELNDAAQFTISVIGVASSANTIYDVVLAGYEW